MDTLLKTDAYEFTMLSSLVESGLADQPASFELFARKLPDGRRFGLLAGLGRFLQMLDEWVLDQETLDTLKEFNLVSSKTVDWLEPYLGKKMFNGDIFAYREGDVYYPYSPVVRVSGKLGEAILLETLLLSVFNHDTAVVSAAARMVIVSDGKPIIEMGSRRTDDEAAISAARAAYIAGFVSTSNVLAAKKFGIPTSGTAAHAYTLAHFSEFDAFVNQMKTWGVETVLLVDTYDTEQGIRNAVKAANSLGFDSPGGIRIDSGDLLVETQKARELLDSLGAVDTKIVVSSDLDEFLMTELKPAPIDGFGAGTRVVTGSGFPTAGMVYKLVEIDGRSVAKKSHDKISVGGVKTPYRTVNGEEFYSLDGFVPADGVKVQFQFVKNGMKVLEPDLDTVRKFAADTISHLSVDEKKVSFGSVKQFSKLV